MIALFGVVQASHGLGANAADSLFFQRFGVENLPLMILISGFAVMVSILGHGSGLVYRGPARWLPVVTVVCAGWASLEWVGAQLDFRAVYPLIWISTQVLIMVTFTVMWNAAGAACTTRQAKRLFPIFATAGVAGGVLGNLLTGPLATTIGTPNLLLVQALLLAGGSVLLLRTRRLFAADDSDRPAPILVQISDTFATLRSSRFLLLAAVIAVAMFCLFYLVYFPFSESVATAFPTEAETAGFLGVFSSIATAATFLFSLLVTNRLFTRLGLVRTLLIVPIVYGIGFATWLAVFNLTSASIVRGMQWVTVNAIALTAFTALFNVMTGRKRAQMTAFMTAVPAQAGVVLAGVLLLISTSMPIQALFGIGLAISLITLVTVLTLRKEYLGAVVSAVQRGVIGLFDPPSRTVFTPVDADAVAVLKEHLADPRPEARALALASLARLGMAIGTTDIEPLLDDNDPRVRAAAFESVCSIEPDRVASHATSAMADEVPEVRLEVLRYLASHPEQDAASVARTALNDPDARVRAAAAAIAGGEDGERVIGELLEADDPSTVAVALIEAGRYGSSVSVDPTPYLAHGSPRVRAAAATAVRHTKAVISTLRPALDDRSHRVRQAAAASLGATSDGRDLLLDVLSTGSVNASEAALHELAPVEDLVDDFTSWARSEAERAALLMTYAKAIDSKPSPVRQYLLHVMEVRSRRIVQWVLLAMTTRETKAVMPMVARGVESPDAEIQSQAIEALESIGARDVLSVLLPLIESDDMPSTMTSDGALAELATDFDPWLKALATRALKDHAREGAERSDVASLASMGPDETQPILDLIDRMVVLQRAHMFSDLDPEDLEPIARVTTESRYGAGDPIYLEGETGDEMLLIIDGSAVVTVTEEDRQRLIHVYGPGDHVGELSLLVGGQRTADVHAGDDGVRGLALSTADLMTVLEERPTVAMGMLGTLARRLIEQT